MLAEKVGRTVPEGPITSFQIKVITNRRFPTCEPKVFETGGRIPRTAERHINPDGDCCVTVWEEWLTNSDDTSFAAFLVGPLREYFLGQYWFEKTGKWPFGERSHGEKGLIEAFADALGVPNQKGEVIYHLRLLSQDWPTGHWACPCGSGRLLRHCHSANLLALHERIPPRMAKRMLRRLELQYPRRPRKFARRLA